VRLRIRREFSKGVDGLEVKKGRKRRRDFIRVVALSRGRVDQNHEFLTTIGVKASGITVNLVLRSKS